MLSNPQPGVDSALDALRAPDDEVRPRRVRRHLPKRLMVTLAVLLGAFLILTFSTSVARAPREFPLEARVSIARGMTLDEASQVLNRQKLIRSPLAFKVFSLLLGGNRGLKAGEYRFTEPLSAFGLASHLTSGVFGDSPVRVTIPEGSNNRQIAAMLKKQLPEFDTARFLSLAAPKEGYLFPDTYFLSTAATEEQVVGIMEGNFQARLEPLLADIARFGQPLRETLIMASLLEEEARTDETRRKIAGILWKRLKLGMPLQVDAVFPYIFGGRPFDLTNGDLLVDSLYNTYKYVGFPPGPVTNPGLDAVRAAITPIETPYLYYLSDKQGEMHYARTHEEHLQNRERYLNGP